MKMYAVRRLSFQLIIMRIRQQAGAELCQAQVKLEIVVEIGV